MILGALTNFPKFENSNCAKLQDKDFFFPVTQVELEDRLPVLEQLCGSCPNLEDCREFAIKEEIIEGFWGGMTPNVRKKIIKRNKAKEDRRSEAVREVQQLLDLGFTKEQIAQKLGIQTGSLERRIERAKKKGIL